ncbi:MAG: type 2 lantipeptide synthetase LanM, partial [Proteobacteria bacterium]
MRVEQGYDPADPLFREGNLSRWVNSPYCAPALPIIYYFASRLRDSIKALTPRPELFTLSPEALTDSLLARLDAKLSRQIHRAVILEINGDRIMGLLQGETPEARFRDFTKQMQSAERRARFFADYPVLFDTLHAALSDWREANEEFLIRLRADFAELQSTFGATGAFAKFADGSGDSHNRGRSVMVLEFASGKRIVYKPHNIDVDAQFQNFLHWMSQQGLPTERLLFLAKEKYGWVEFVTNSPCANEAEVETFYERAGQLLAALYLLGGTDVHSENLIARGAQPIVIDVETLFHPHVIDNTLPNPSDDARSLLTKEIGNSVLKTDFLPRLKGAPERAADQSGLGGRAGQATAIKGRGVVSMGTDEIRIAETTYTTGQVRNRPRLEGKEIRVNGDALVRGFEHGYRVFLENRSVLLELLEGFRHLTIRAVPRNS